MTAIDYIVVAALIIVIILAIVDEAKHPIRRKK